uniref:U-box domain-containing protein 52 n=1 Tax=Erigeron canadensis TaxID=72917 RepID=UPI001CB9249D|nr:U-box domain-containing protein 52 [Erigeron canadensis]
MSLEITSSKNNNIVHEQIMEIEQEEETTTTSRSHQTWRRVMSPEIVEIEEQEISHSSQYITSTSSNREGVDVYVAVGKNDLDVVKWAVDHVVAPGGSSSAARVYLVHVFPPVTNIPTPVGKLSRSQLSKEQVQVYINEENNKRRSLLQKYIRLCNDAKINVETMLLESNTTTKAILDLIHVVNITKLVIGTKRAPPLRRLRKGPGKGEFLKKNAPDFCEVSIVYNGKEVMERHAAEVSPPSNNNVPTATTSSSQNGRLKNSIAHNLQGERKLFFECACFSKNFD